MNKTLDTAFCVKCAVIGIFLGMKNETLAHLVRQRIDHAYGENQAAFARKMKVSPQAVTAIVKGHVTSPQADFRRRLAEELTIPLIQIFVMAGEIEEGDLVAAGVTGAPPEGPASHLHAIIGQYEWEWNDALEFGDQIQAVLIRRNKVRSQAQSGEEGRDESSI